jgi:hypothetical protein
LCGDPQALRDVDGDHELRSGINLHSGNLAPALHSAFAQYYPHPVHLLFLDESGRIDHGGLFALGGIAVRDTDWPRLRRLWQETLSAAGWPLDREIKWHALRFDLIPDFIPIAGQLDDVIIVALVLRRSSDPTGAACSGALARPGSIAATHAATRRTLSRPP